jgi:hypothetical protein
MTQIEDVRDTDGVLFHVQTDGNMACMVAGVQLWPTPAWLCRQVVLQAGRQELNDAAVGRTGCGAPIVSDDVLYQRGAQALQDNAPCALQLPFELLHSREEQPS